MPEHERVDDIIVWGDSLDHVFLKWIFSSWGTNLMFSGASLGNIGCRFQEGLGNSFSRENMTYFGSWILTHISLVF